MFILLVSCSPGTFWDGYVSKIIQPSPGDKRKVHYSICSPCPIGHYQDQSGSIECNRCPMNHSSVVEGSKNVEDCKGEHSKNHALLLTVALFVVYHRNV